MILFDTNGSFCLSVGVWDTQVSCQNVGDEMHLSLRFAEGEQPLLCNTREPLLRGQNCYRCEQGMFPHIQDQLAPSLRQAIIVFPRNVLLRKQFENTEPISMRVRVMGWLSQRMYFRSITSCEQLLLITQLAPGGSKLLMACIKSNFERMMHSIEVPVPQCLRQEINMLSICYCLARV